MDEWERRTGDISSIRTSMESEVGWWYSTQKQTWKLIKVKKIEGKVISSKRILSETGNA